MAAEGDADKTSLFVKFAFDIWRDSDDVVKIILLLVLVVLVAILVKSPIYRYFTKKWGSGEESKPPEKEIKVEGHSEQNYRSDIMLAIHALQEVSTQMADLTKVIEDLQSSWVEGNDRIAGILSSNITVLSDFAAELRRNRLYPEESDR